jgi:hypothetical protein
MLWFIYLAKLRTDLLDNRSLAILLETYKLLICYTLVFGQPLTADFTRTDVDRQLDLSDLSALAAETFDLGLAAAAKPKPTVRALWRENTRSSQLSREEAFSGKMRRRDDVFTRACGLSALPSSPSFWESCGTRPSPEGAAPHHRVQSYWHRHLSPSN